MTSVFGHSDPSTARIYTKSSSRRLLAERAMNKTGTFTWYNSLTQLPTWGKDRENRLNFNALNFRWYALGDSNPCFRRERAAS